MSGIIDVSNMCFIKYITNRWLIRIMMIKGRNSWHNKINHNKGDFRDGVLNGFE